MRIRGRPLRTEYIWLRPFGEWDTCRAPASLARRGGCDASERACTSMLREAYEAALRNPVLMVGGGAVETIASKSPDATLRFRTSSASARRLREDLRH